MVAAGSVVHPNLYALLEFSRFLRRSFGEDTFTVRIAQALELAQPAKWRSRFQLLGGGVRSQWIIEQTGSSTATRSGALSSSNVAGDAAFERWRRGVCVFCRPMVRALSK